MGSTGSAGDFRPPGTLTIGARNDVELPLQDVMIFDDRQDAVPDGHDGFGTSGLSLTTPGFARVESVLELNSPMAGRGSDLPRTTAELLARFQSGPFSFMAFRPGDSDDASQHLFGFATVAKAAETPEPTTLFLLGTGACALIKQPRRAKI
jgi:hypothetical protein